MSDLLSILKRASLYTLIYMALFFIVFWTTFFVLVTLQAFWKFFLFVFFAVLALVTFDHIKGTDWTNSALISPSDLKTVLSK